ncbi:hypothetical protein D3C83_263720 [compost metagenome]
MAVTLPGHQHQVIRVIHLTRNIHDFDSARFFVETRTRYFEREFLRAVRRLCPRFQ